MVGTPIIDVRILLSSQVYFDIAPIIVPATSLALVGQEQWHGHKIITYRRLRPRPLVVQVHSMREKAKI